MTSMIDIPGIPPRRCDGNRSPVHRSNKCRVHPDDNYTVICTNCVVLLCNKCLYDTNNRHRLCPISCLSEDVSGICDQVKSKVTDDANTIKDKVHELRNALCKKRERMTKKKNETLLEIQRYFQRLKDRLMVKLRREEDELLKHLNDTVNEQDETLSGNAENCNKISYNIQEKASMVDNFERIFRLGGSQSSMGYLNNLVNLSGVIRDFEDRTKEIEAARDAFLVIRFFVNSEIEQALVQGKVAYVEVLNSRDNTSSQSASNLESEGINAASSNAAGSQSDDTQTPVPLVNISGVGDDEPDEIDVTRVDLPPEVPARSSSLTPEPWSPPVDDCHRVVLHIPDIPPEAVPSQDDTSSDTNGVQIDQNDVANNSTAEDERANRETNETSNCDNVDTDLVPDDEPPPPYPGHPAPAPAPGELPPPYPGPPPPPYASNPDLTNQHPLPQYIGGFQNAEPQQPATSNSNRHRQRGRLNGESGSGRNTSRNANNIGRISPRNLPETPGTTRMRSPLAQFAVGEPNDKRSSGICAMAMLEDSSYLVVDRWNKKLKYFNSGGGSLGGLLFREEPWDLAKIVLDSFAVSVPKLNSIYRVKAAAEGVVTTSTIATVRKYACIAFHSENSMFVCGQVPQFGEPVIDIFSVDGGPVLLSFRTDIQGRDLFSYPRYVKVLHDGTAVVCDWNLKCLVIFKLDGTVLGRYKGTRDYPLNDPTGIALDPTTGHAYVIDAKQNSADGAVHKIKLDCSCDWVFLGSNVIREARAVCVSGNRLATGSKSGTLSILSMRHRYS